MAERTQRTIDGPDRDLLEITEVIAYLRLSAPTLKRLIAAGEFPRPIAISEGVRVWSWHDVVYWKLRSELRPRLKPAKAPKKRKPDQGGSPPDHGGSSGKRKPADA
ncbi:: Phage_AlpA [Gemmataceae bacterium]|nr:: Phage_AlpA [Gemmataceae bacterium]VTT96526.1 : Phage_AlpA [Gemmataceae bacterium]